MRHTGSLLPHSAGGELLRKKQSGRYLCYRIERRGDGADAPSPCLPQCSCTVMIENPFPADMLFCDQLAGSESTTV
jgi:hypothetical protein